MNEYLKIAGAFLEGIPWLAVVSICISLGFLWTARQALSTWRRELKTRREMQFWDEINNALHEFLLKIHPAISQFGVIKLCLDSQSESWDSSKGDSLGWLDNYIHHDGEHHSNLLLSSLKESAQDKAALDSLASKGQVFDIVNYVDCRIACNNLTNVYIRLEAFAYAIQRTANFNNPEVVRIYEKIVALTADELHQQIIDHNVAIVEFIQQGYRRLFSD